MALPRVIGSIAVLTLLAGCASTPSTGHVPSPDSAVAPAAASAPATPAPATGVASGHIDTRPFPRDFTAGGTAFKIHQPQYDGWSGDHLTGRFAVSVATGSHVDAQGHAQDTFDYGVVHFRARTQIDKEARAVVLTDLAFGPASFPTAPDKQAAYLAMVNGLFHPGTTLTVSLDQLEAALAIDAAGARATSLPVDDTPPDILFHPSPAVLVQVDGAAALRASGSQGVQRVINTRSLLLVRAGRYYLYLAHHWLSAASLTGPWRVDAEVDEALVAARDRAVAARKVDTLDNPPEELAQAFAGGGVPYIAVRTHPAELITTEGDPEFVDVPGTKLSYIANTGADVFVDTGSGYAWYVLVSGRWFSASGSHGPWHYVDPASLPGDFTRIPADSPKSGVLASIPGTPEAEESLIANSIPQTATVQRGSAHLDVPYDGEPRFRPIDGTHLQYAWNTPVPVIRVDAGHFYAVDKGIWFVAASATGPWTVADSVPADIYRIPTRSPLHYVTYVRVYGSSGDEVYVGYTPGYYGTVVSDDVVVYGTGYGCDPWLGSDWYGCPATYGMGVYFGWNPWVGWTFGWGWGWYGGWYGGYDPWWGPWWGPSYPWGWWGGGAAAWNVYGHWGAAAVRGTAVAWANPWTGNVGRAGRGGYVNEATGGRGAGRAAINTNAYTGTTRARASGIRYNPQTGRVVAGQVAAAGNPYTGRAGVAGERTALNTRSGRVTSGGGAVAAGPAGAAGAGAFTSRGAGGDVAAAGGFHYNADTGQLNHGGAARINDNVYAGHDGHVYRYDGGQWQPVTRPSRPASQPAQTRALDLDRQAREQGWRMESHGSRPIRAPTMNRSMGGFRPGLGVHPMRGGFRGR